MNIPSDEWQAASGSYVVDRQGRLWRIVGFIDQPAMCLEPVGQRDGDDRRQRQTIVMGSRQSEDFTRLVPQE